jgi:hypothetical protein
MKRSESVSPLGVGVPVTNETLIPSAARRLIWLALSVLASLRAMRGPGETYSDVIIRVVGGP